MKLTLTDDQGVLLASWRILNTKYEEGGDYVDFDNFHLIDSELADPRTRQVLMQEIGEYVVGEVIIGRKQGYK